MFAGLLPRISKRSILVYAAIFAVGVIVGFYASKCPLLNPGEQCLLPSRCGAAAAAAPAPTAVALAGSAGSPSAPATSATTDHAPSTEVEHKPGAADEEPASAEEDEFGDINVEAITPAVE